MIQCRPFPLTPSAHVVSGVPADDWYVDSVNGNDGNSGRSPQAPLQTLAALIAKPVVSGQTAFLFAGSTWREQLTGLPAGVTIRAYGSGATPIVTGSDVIANASWSKTGGRTNIYQYSFTASFDAAGGKTQHRAFEDGTPLRRVATYTGGSLAADLTTLDATPGGFIAPTPTGGADVIYIHASDSSNVTTNGKVYELSKRLWAVQLYDYVGHATVVGIEGRNNAHADGQIVVDGTALNCISRNGRVHNIFVRGLCEGCYAYGMEPSDTIGGSTSYVTHQSDGGGQPAHRNTIYRRCYAYPGTAVGRLGNHNSDTNIAFYAHVTGSDDLGVLQFEDCYAEESLTGFDAAQCSQTLYYNCSTGPNVKYGIASHPGADDSGTGGVLLVLGGTYNVAGIDSQWIHYESDFQIPDTIIARGCKVYKTGGGIGPIVINIASTAVSITRCTVTSNTSGGIPWLETGNFVFDHNVVYGPQNLLMLRRGVTGVGLPSYTGDYNCFWNTADAGAHFQAGGGGSYTDYLSLAAWQAASAQDANSIAQNPSLTDPANGDFTIGNATVVAMGAGALASIANDSTAQALWASYRVGY